MFRILFALLPAQVLLVGQPSAAVERAKESVALLLAGRPTAGLAQPGAAVVLRSSGVLVTSYSLVRDATSLQVRFRNGEVFDHVELLGADRRRGIAAIRIPAQQLTEVQLAERIPERGSAVTVISHGAGMNWNTANGVLSDVVSADRIAGAGSGYKLIESTAPAPAGSAGGLLLDADGRALGVLVAAPTGTQTATFAIPIADIAGLADSSPTAEFGSRSASIRAKEAAATPDAPEKSEALGASGSREDLLRAFKTMYVDATNAKFFGSDQMKAALGRNKGFAPLDIRIVDDRRIADTVLVVGYTFAWDFPFELKHQNTTTVLIAGKGAGPFSGPAGAASVASEFVKAMRPFRAPAAKR